MYKMFNPASAGDDIGVDFDLEVDGVLKKFRVNSEVIEDLTKSEKLHGKARIDAFQQKADRIFEVAERKFGSPGNGRILLSTEDF